ncbi:hypothetical protein HKX48_006737 [Thoreauomyces humboldtii]|nr:hypothetical protein HKX48_006737 [Thoreauomyces humboldtii]
MLDLATLAPFVPEPLPAAVEGLVISNPLGLSALEAVVRAFRKNVGDAYELTRKLHMKETRSKEELEREQAQWQGIIDKMPNEAASLREQLLRFKRQGEVNCGLACLPQPPFLQSFVEDLGEVIQHERKVMHGHILHAFTDKKNGKYSSGLRPGESDWGRSVLLPAFST